MAATQFLGRVLAYPGTGPRIRAWIASGEPRLLHGTFRTKRPLKPPDTYVIGNMMGYGIWSQLSGSCGPEGFAVAISGAANHYTAWQVVGSNPSRHC